MPSKTQFTLALRFIVLLKLGFLWMDKRREMGAEVVCGQDVTVAVLLMYQCAARAAGAETGRGSSETSIIRRLRFSSHLPHKS